MIITREWINSDVEINIPFEGAFNHLQISEVIDYWKNQLLHNGAKYGDKIGIATSYMDSTYVGIIFASLELGLKIVILSKPTNELQASQFKSNAYLPLDVLITNKEDFTNKFVLNFFKTNSKIIINTDFVEKIDNIIPLSNFPKPEDTCLLCTSSGSTDKPKLINHSHKFFYELCSFNWKPLEFTEEDHVLHLIAINHGSALGVYFLPSLYKCKKHYFMIDYFIVNSSDYENWDKWVDFCIKNKITKVHSSHSNETNNMINAVKRSKKGLPNLTIIILSYINPEWLSVIKEGKLKKIISVFGSSETSGPLVMSYVDKETKDFNPKLFSNPVSGFHEISLDINNELTVYIPTYNQTIKTEDFFKKTPKGWYFVSKNKLYRLNDIEININDIQNIFQNNFDKPIVDDVCILVDEVYSKLYAVTTNKSILFHSEQIKKDIKEFYDNNIILNKIFFIENIKDFVVGIKPDRQKMLDYIRQLEANN